MMRENKQKLEEKVRELRLQGEFQEMLEVCYHLLQVARDLGDHELQMKTYANYALGFYETGDVQEAFLYIEKHAALCQDYGTKEDQMYSYHILHLLYEYTGEFEKAKDTLEASIEIGVQLQKCNIVAENYSDLSFILCRMEDYNSALEVAEKAATIAAMLEPYSPFLIMKAILSTIQAHIGKEEYEEAEGLLEILIRDSKLKDYAKEKIRCYRLLSTVQQLRDQTTPAIDSLLTANKSAQQASYVKQQMEIQEELIFLYRSLEDFRSGFVVQEQQIDLLKGIHRQDNEDAASKLATKMKLAELERQVNTDFLTGIASRRSLEETANDWLMESTRNDENIVCIAFDIDNLKTWNDHYGHQFGDQVIRQVAKTCKALLRRSDITGRVGGDEFVAVLRNISLKNACQKAQEILESVVAIELEHEGKKMPITLSIGVAESKYGMITDYATLYNEADIVLYRAKRNGKNQVFCSE